MHDEYRRWPRIMVQDALEQNNVKPENRDGTMTQQQYCCSYRYLVHVPRILSHIVPGITSCDSQGLRVMNRPFWSGQKTRTDEVHTHMAYGVHFVGDVVSQVTHGGSTPCFCPPGQLHSDLQVGVRRGFYHIEIRPKKGMYPPIFWPQHGNVRPRHAD